MKRLSLFILLFIVPSLTYSQTSVDSTITEKSSGSSASGDVVGPASSIDNAIVRFDGVTGKLIQGYTSDAPVISDDGILTIRDGASATPSIRFSSQNTGFFYSPINATTGFSQNGTEFMRMGAASGAYGLQLGSSISSIQGFTIGTIGSSSTSGGLLFSTAQTSPAMALATHPTSNNLIFAGYSDLYAGYNFGHAAQTNPTVFFHSAAQSTNQWGSLAHDGTDFLVTSGLGRIGLTHPAGSAIGVWDDGSVNNGTLHIGKTNKVTMTWDGSVNGILTTSSTYSFAGYRWGAASIGLYLLNIGQSGNGSNLAGADSWFSGGLGTGTAASGNVVLRGGPSIASGSTYHTTVDRFVVVSKGKALTDATAVSLFEVALPTLTMTGGVIHACVQATNGTDMQMLCQDVTYAAVNKGAAYTTDIEVTIAGATPLVTEQQGAKSVSAGTLVNTWTILTGTNKITIQLSADTSLTPSGTNGFVVYYTINNNSQQTVTVL